MDISKIKQLVKSNGDKFIFLENGEPEIVMMSFREYEKLAQRDPNIRMTPELSEYSPISHSDHSDDKFGSLGSFPEGAGLPVRLEDIRLEDLPI